MLLILSRCPLHRSSSPSVLQETRLLRRSSIRKSDQKFERSERTKESPIRARDEYIVLMSFYRLMSVQYIVYAPTSDSWASNIKWMLERFFLLLRYLFIAPHILLYFRNTKIHTHTYFVVLWIVVVVIGWGRLKVPYFDICEKIIPVHKITS